MFRVGYLIESFMKKHRKNFECKKKLKILSYWQTYGIYKYERYISWNVEKPKKIQWHQRYLIKMNNKYWIYVLWILKKNKNVQILYRHPT